MQISCISGKYLESDTRRHENAKYLMAYCLISPNNFHLHILIQTTLTTVHHNPVT